MNACPPWTHIPKPDRVARLPHIGAMPVVFITCYSTNPVPTVLGRNGVEAGCDCTYGIGKPQIGVQCTIRQRQVMAERRCSVCGQTAPGEELLFAGVERSAEFGGRLFSMEGGAHAECLAYSAQTCPVLVANRGKVTVAATREYGLVKRLILGHRADRPVYGLWPHGVPHGPLGTLDFHIAVFDDQHTRTLMLDTWLCDEAPDLGRL
ncbi:hypothetical protein BC739_006724 [Kutzneria viridogrisea]|uniref:Uncharacterized protein n=1 Tax=Kutzneria viridogrisea TaxID=47990 RepID=A0ABR6BRF6_9PSEU|nr:hypothetical protein [Kutzneria viridogrisea]